MADAATSASKAPSGAFSGVRKFAKDTWLITKDAAVAWYNFDPFQNSAVLAFYTIFSLPGLLVISIALAGYFFGSEAVTKEISRQVALVVGIDAADDIKTIVEKASRAEGSVLSSIIGIATLLFGATGVFYQLQQILNRIWHVKPGPRMAFLKTIRARLFSFGLVLAIGFLLLVSLVMSAVLSAVGNWIASHFSESLLVAFRAADVGTSLAAVTVLLAAIYKYLPDARIRWREVWVGSLVTASLFVVAKFLLGLWLGSSKIGTTYGAAGTVILIMLWVSYASLILLFGAQFTRAYATRFGRKIEPARGAVSTRK